jgi:hypothetical protein
MRYGPYYHLWRIKMEINNHITNNNPIPNFSNVLPHSNSEVVINQTLKDDMNPSAVHANNNVMDDYKNGGGLSIYV